MKIRIKANTVRFRLSKSEIAALATDGILKETTEFPGSSLTYSIVETDQENLSADFIDQTIKLFIPGILLKQWANSTDIGIKSTMQLSNNKMLHLLVEKDFKCIDADVMEDQSDYFENPHSVC